MITTKALKAVAGTAVLLSLLTPASAAGDAPVIERRPWSFSGINGKFDRAQLQRGFQIYKDVCAACHGLKRVYFRNLSEPGGPEFPVESVKALAASWPNQIFAGPNDAGEIADRRGRINKRPALLSDPILGPYDNDKAATAANNGALPPDLSLLTKSRTGAAEFHGPLWAHPLAMLKDMATGYQEGGTDYVYALLTGYGSVPEYRRNTAGQLVPAANGGTGPVEKCASITKGEAGKPDVCNALQEGMNYNSAFPGHQIAMIPPLPDGTLKYQDGSPGTTSQYAQDVAAFLTWAGDPKLEERKDMGRRVLLYLLITSLLLYFAKKRLWSKLH